MLKRASSMQLALEHAHTCALYFHFEKKLANDLSHKEGPIVVIRHTRMMEARDVRRGRHSAFEDENFVSEKIKVLSVEKVCSQDRQSPSVLTLSSSLTIKGAFTEATLPVVIRSTCLVRDSVERAGNLRRGIGGGGEGETEGGGMA